ncbi:MAG: VCBS repeat-containing protein [Planctomycetes bacterium]|nr:VCBS repeat-containing protein [Planctomycetota bacterium]
MIFSFLLLSLCQTTQGFELNRVPEHLAFVQLDDDPALECIAIDGEVLTLLPVFGQETEIQMPLPGSAGIWTVSDLGSNPVFLHVSDGHTLRQLQLNDGTLAWGAPLASELGKASGFPRGHRRAHFVLDLNHDGFLDLVLPAGESIAISFGSEGDFRPPVLIDDAANVSLSIGGAKGGLLGEVNRTYQMRPLEMQDLNGDGLADLQRSDSESIRQYLATKDGLSATPHVIDLTRFSESTGEIKFDAANIAALSKHLIMEEWADLNQDGSLDMILLVGHSIVIYLGGKDGLDVRRPRDQFNLHGNILYAFAEPIDDDGFPDLCFLKVEDLSLAQVLSWIIFPVSIDFDLLAYRGLGNGRFEKHALYAKRIKFKSDSVFGLLNRRDEARAVRRTVSLLADLDGDGLASDLALLDGEGTLSLYKNLVADISTLEHINEDFLREQLKGDGDASIDEDMLMGWVYEQKSTLLNLAAGHEPIYQIEASAGDGLEQALTAQDIDGDGKDEVLLLRMIKKDGVNGLKGFWLDLD